MADEHGISEKELNAILDRLVKGKAPEEIMDRRGSTVRMDHGSLGMGPSSTITQSPTTGAGWALEDDVHRTVWGPDSA